MAEQDSTKHRRDAEPSLRVTTSLTTESTGTAASNGVVLEADLQAHIGRQLRSVYNEVVSEAVPDRFLKLLEELERKQADRS